MFKTAPLTLCFTQWLNCIDLTAQSYLCTTAKMLGMNDNILTLVMKIFLGKGLNLDFLLVNIPMFAF